MQDEPGRRADEPVAAPVPLHAPYPSPVPRLSPPRPQGSALGRAARLALVGAAFAVAVAVRFPLCPFALITRHPCPGCGLTRAALALATGDLREAIHFHPLVIPVVPVVALLLLQGSYNYVRHGRWYTFAFQQTRFVTLGSIVLAVAMIAVWFARFFGAFGGPVAV
ncbi:DUF2752 domain-containing protein [Polyangium mundeleinium]|uniref:DUF2752 domain-containing protein n=1 Tax=Polyangium mundeleinium TaxID=2995306 RepID=A0ABT5EVA7_9BACT|nr:DUF2752 domain-containing protein [Polyangium mundeleinium]MDC0745756.1 DUF2752 domain-containing protein [Polyangium mundeleinium]